jgi:hypothetical protein
VWKYQMESIFFTIGCLGIARGDAKKKLTKQLGLSHEEIAKRKRFNKSFVEKRNLGFNLLVQSMGMNAMYQSVISTTCEIGDLFGAWKAIWDKYDSKKPAMQSQLATEFANCFQMPDEPMETFLNKINEICARMVTDPGDDMKKAQVVKGVIDDFYSFAAQETRKVSSWSDFCASMIDQATQTADIADFRQKRRAAIALELGKKRSRTGDSEVPEEHPAGEDSVNYASSHETECWSCGKKGHKKYNCPKLLKKEKKEKKEKKKKNDRKRKEKLRVRLDDSEASSSDSD